MQALRSYCAAASPSAHRVPLGASRRFSALPRRSLLSLGRFAMTCTAASLNRADECAAFVLPSPQWFAPTFPHRTYCRCKCFFSHRAAASPSAHRIPLGDSRRFSAPLRRSLLSLGRFAMICTAASLSYVDECTASVLPSPQWFAPTFPHCTYCRRKRFVPIAPPPAHQLIAFFRAVRASISPPHPPAARNRA